MKCGHCDVEMDTEGSPLYPNCNKCHECFCSLECYEEHSTFCPLQVMLEEGKTHYFRCCDCNILKEENEQQPIFIPDVFLGMAKGVCSSCVEKHK